MRRDGISFTDIVAHECNISKSYFRESEETKMEIIDKHPEMVEVFTRYITKNGKRIYPKNARFFHFWVPAGERQHYDTAEPDTKKESPEDPAI